MADAASAARVEGNFLGASRLTGALINLTDAASDWVEYADLLLQVPTASEDERQGYAWRGLSASVNAYLRAERSEVTTRAPLAVESNETNWGLEVMGNRRFNFGQHA